MPDIGVNFRVDGADQFTRAVRDMETQARRFGSTVQTTFQPAQTAVRSLTSALSAFSTIVRLTGNENDELARKMETFAFAIASVTLAVQSLRGASAGLAAALAVLRVGVASLITGLIVLVAALLGPFGVVLALSVAAGIAFGLLGEKTGFAARATRDLVDAQKSLASVSLALTQQTERQLASEGQSVEQLKKNYKDFTEKQQQLAEAAGDRRFRQRVETIEREAAAEEAVARTILSTTAQLARQIEIKQQSIAAFERLIRAGGLTSDQLQDLQAKVASLSNELVGLKGQLDTTSDSWQLLARALGGVQRLVEQGVEAGLKLADAIRKEREETAFANQLAQERAARLREAASQIAAYRDALDEARQAQEDWNRQNAFDARQQGEIETGFRRREIVLQRSVELMDAAVAKRRAEVAGLQQLTAAIQAEVAALEREIAAKIAAGIPTEELAKSATRLRDALGEIEHRSALAARALQQALGDPARQLAQGLADAFQRSFEDMLQNARDVGDAIVGFFRGVVNALISMFARFVAQKFFDFLLPLFAPAFPVPGFSVPIGAPPVAAQHGKIFDRPTLTWLAEGGEREMAIPERFWPALGRGRSDEGRRSQELVVKVITVFDRDQIPATDPNEVVMIVNADIRRGGPIEQTIRRMVR